MKSPVDFAREIAANLLKSKSIAPVDSGDNTIRGYSVGDKFVRNGVLYKAKQSIAINTPWSSLTLNTDYEEDTLLVSQIDGKAPENHASSTTKYGVGSTTDYGHVKVDNALSTTSENPVQNKVVNGAIDKAKKLVASVEVNPASSNHAVGTQLIYNDILYEATTAISVNDSLVAYPTSGYNIKAVGDVSSQIQALSNQADDMNNILGAKNLLKNDIVQQTIDGTLQVTKNPDDSITISGTASQTRWLDISTAINLKDGVEYILSGFPTGLHTDNRLSYEEIVNGVAVIYNDDGSGVTFTPNPNRTSNKVFIRVQNGQSFTPAITIRPMIRPASIEDDTYVPYAKGNRELTENVSSIHYQYYNYADGTTEIALPSDWKEMIVMTNLNKGNYMVTAHFTNDMMDSGLTNHSFGNYGTSYAVGQISKSKVKLTSAKFSDSDVTNNTRISIYLR